MWGRRISDLIWLVITLSLFASILARAAEPASLGVEVKFFLNPPKVLDADYTPDRALLAAFQVEKEPKRIQMQFLDGSKTELHKEKWDVRLRTIQGEDHLELTFKRRYPVEDHLEAALANAAREGFDAAENDYKPELEWGYQKQTLTFASEKRASHVGARNLNLPSGKNARELVFREKMPEELKHWKERDWAKRVLSTARVYGPVEGKRWPGSHADIDDEISIEVWALPTDNGRGVEHIVEISFKKKEYDGRTRAKREKLLELLKKEGWLWEEDVLKTELILKRCAQPGRCPVRR
jgi:hypothetical protein